MVVTSVLSKVIPIAAVGIGLAFLYNILQKPSAASESAGALGQTFFSIGSGLGSVGGGHTGLFNRYWYRFRKITKPIIYFKDFILW